MKSEVINQLLNIVIEEVPGFNPKDSNLTKKEELSSQKDIVAIYELKGEVNGFFLIGIDKETYAEVSDIENLFDTLKGKIPYENTFKKYDGESKPTYLNEVSFDIESKLEKGGIQISIAIK